MTTSDPLYSPHDLLPAPEPRTVSPPEDYFYDNVVKHLVKDTVRIMNTGLPIDLDRVEELEVELDSIIAEVKTTLANNTYIQQYLNLRYSNQIQAYQEAQLSKLRQPDAFLKPFDSKKPDHRSYFMYLFAQRQGIQQPTELLPTGIPKWSAKDVKKLSTTRPILQRLLIGTLTDAETLEAMQLLAQHKADLFNKSYEDKANAPNIPYPEFNPSSPQQKQELFTMLGIKSEASSKATGDDKWDRAQIERLLKETSDPILQELLQAFIDFSFAAIVRNNFIEAFYKYTVDGRLHGQYKLFGAKSFRYTSSNPNMLNSPSTKSKFAKPIKRCFIAPEGFIVGGIDYSALEDRVFANLTKDANKCALFLDDLDGHSLSATYYYPDRVKAIIGDYTDNKQASIALKALVDAGDPAAEKVRQDAKPVSFGLAYGSHPPKVAATIKCTLAEATQIFDAYHNQMYPGITDYRENYILPTALENGKLHLGLGCYIKSDNPDRDIRTIHNSSAQFWSILTVLTINKLHTLIDQAGYTNDIQITSTIYDAIYFCIRDDATIIKWLNDTLIPIMEQDFLDNQIVHNKADLEIGTDWSNIGKNKLPHNCSTDYIQGILDGFKTTSSPH